MQRERFFSSAPEALSFMGSMRANGVECWCPDFHMSTLWGGWWYTMNGFRVVWSSGRDDVDIATETLPVSTSFRTERFSDVFRSRSRRRAFVVLLMLFVCAPIPHHRPEDIIGEYYWMYHVMNWMNER